MNEHLSARRFGLLLRNDVVGGYRTFGIHAATVAVLIASASLLNMFFNGESMPPVIWFSLLLCIWGPIVASRAFNDLHNKTRNESFLLLPASALEKTLARLLLVTVGFLVFLLIYATALSFSTEMLSLFIFGERNELFRPFDPRAWEVIRHFVGLQSVFFLGAAFFRKNHFWKTVLSIVALSTACVGFVALLGFLLFGRAGLTFDEGEMYGIYLGHVTLFGLGVAAAKLAYYLVLPAFCWFVAWLRVRETQVSYGV